ncbi:hypothetical protein [Caldimonas sp. KR1-144]|uniref:hypothetical protein n=1 Tax=Caldimonas sp. KR1-144 TaxID=3400911 RepID=UPI003C0EF876
MNTISLAGSERVPAIARRCLQLALVYLIVGIAIGIGMGATQDFTLRPVHAHINLLGWTTLALAGLTYGVFPALAASRLAAVQFWLHNLSLPVMMGSLAMLLLGKPQVAPALVASEFGMAGAIVALTVNAFINLRGPRAPAAA